MLFDIGILNINQDLKNKSKLSKQIQPLQMDWFWFARLEILLSIEKQKYLRRFVTDEIRNQNKKSKIIISQL